MLLAKKRLRPHRPEEAPVPESPTPASHRKERNIERRRERKAEERAEKDRRQRHDAEGPTRKEKKEENASRESSSKPLEPNRPPSADAKARAAAARLPKPVKGMDERWKGRWKNCKAGK